MRNIRGIPLLQNTLCCPLHPHSRTNIQACNHSGTFAHTHTHTSAHTHARMHTRTCAHTDTHTHTNIYSMAKFTMAKFAVAIYVHGHFFHCQICLAKSSKAKFALANLTDYQMGFTALERIFWKETMNCTSYHMNKLIRVY